MNTGSVPKARKCLTRPRVASSPSQSTHAPAARSRSPFPTMHQSREPGTPPRLSARTAPHSTDAVPPARRDLARPWLQALARCPTFNGEIGVPLCPVPRSAGAVLTAGTATQNQSSSRFRDTVFSLAWNYANWNSTSRTESGSGPNTALVRRRVPGSGPSRSPPQTVGCCHLDRRRTARVSPSSD